MSYTTDSFIAKARERHGNKYDYSKVEYVNSQTKVKIICPSHGLFEQTPAEHLRGRGCMECGRIAIGEKQKHDCSKTFIKRCEEIHADKFSYDKVVYVDSHTDIIVTCKKHGDFITKPYRILNGVGCPRCKSDKLHGIFCKGNENYISDARLVHGDLYDYDLVEYKNNKTPITIVCKKHGRFELNPLSHLRGYGCPKCGPTGEVRIMRYLDNRNISYKREYRLKNDTGIGTNKGFRADFFLPSLNMMIEYNGVQHYRPIKLFGGERRYKEQVERDHALQCYCDKHSIRLLEIPYYEYSNIENILSDNICPECHNKKGEER